MMDALGLSTQAKQLYNAILNTPQPSESGLAQALQFDSETLSDSLNELSDLSLVTSNNGKITVVQPQTAIDSLILRHESELIANKLRLATYRDISAQLKAASPQDATGSIEVFSGRTAINEQLERLSLAARNSVDTFAPGGTHSTNDIAAGQSRNENLFANGVHSRTVYLSTARNSRETHAYTEWLNEQGAEVRTTPKLPIRMILIDQKIAVLPLEVADAMRGILVCRAPSIVKALQELFNLVWDSATPLGFSRAMSTMACPMMN